MKAYCDSCEKDVKVGVAIVTMQTEYEEYSIEYDEPILFCKECSRKLFSEELDDAVLNLIGAKYDIAYYNMDYDGMEQDILS